MQSTYKDSQDWKALYETMNKRQMVRDLYFMTNYCSIIISHWAVDQTSYVILAVIKALISIKDQSMAQINISHFESLFYSGR